jgi:ABC-type sugar transport system substrate-binding protein
LLPLEENPMQNRRRFLLTLSAAFVGMGLVVASVLADELFGVITKVNADAKKITVVEKDTDKEIEVTITDETEYVTKKGSGKVDFEKLEKGIEKAKDKGAKGINVKITHEKNVASKIETQKKKAAN